ncbi:MAG: cation:proton antiporter [Chitinophagaceae bacterium]|nr:cation:proton antiporter [Chitinophagaceae bacterium]HQV60342.1 cation:proton antiporter [Chitinophagaceae bacterium]HQV85008.1 cation:proton antiporter [Chitinophagaceae bacterium]HQX71524.1 cation:proton antiporter [Chitinophagaceae bacterium]HQZ74856.1 cation:proton antiporter [Chitinophagaceae bacterium]
MKEIGAYGYIIAICLLVILSYLFNLISRRTGIPSVLLLLLTGIGVRETLVFNNISVEVSPQMVEIFGILGLIMIILEAGLDLQLGKKKIKLIRNAFFSGLIILVLSAIAISSFLYFYLKEDFILCLIYALPLSVVSSAIVIPSISHLDEHKKEFLVYETSFSDILGIIFFNYLIAGNLLKGSNITWFFGSLIISIVLSIVLSFLMLFMLTRITTKVRFFLVFAVLIFLYAGGKMLHLPSLFIILLFGLIVSNWQLTIFNRLYKWVSIQQVDDVSHLLHSLTAESSFLIRTFFFFIFGLTIDIRLIMDKDVILAGSAIVILLLFIRFIYLRFFLRSHIVPEVFFMPRGLITILLFYSIPQLYKLSKFNEGILFFVILITSIIMMIGSIAYGKPKLQAINDEIPLSDEP